MSKLDTLLGMVDTISARSDKLVNSINESHALISQISELNSSISHYDTEIDSVTQLVGQNNGFLTEFQRLYEKSFFLESNFGYNDAYMNATSYRNLYTEYDYLWNEFHTANTQGGRKRTMKDDNDKLPESPKKKVKNALSISNLTLKPLRCKDTKVSKMKSRYRLSEAYTLNPLQALPIREVSESSAHTDYSNIMATSDQHDESSISSLPSAKTSVSNSPVSVSNREDLTRTPPFSAAENREVIDPFGPASSPLLFKSLYTSELHALEGDDVESSDFEPDSPERFEDFENFHHFLRRSRINLKESFPVLERARSHDSVLKTEAPVPCSVSLSQRKFHNPADMINSQKKSISSQPTVEAIYSKGYDAASKFKEHSAKLLATQQEKQADGQTTPKKAQNFDLFKLMNSPLGSPRGFGKTRTPGKDQGQISASSSSSSCAIPERRNSDIFGMSLASSFMNLVNTSSSVPKNTTLAAPKIGFEASPPEKIKKLRKDLKHPISSKNDIKSKRLPPMERQLRNGSSSFLTIGPNKTKIINHGDSSVFKKPTLRRLSQTLLTDALNESLLF